MDPDPDLNVLTQRLQKTGTFAGKSALSYGALDVFYLHSSGVRSLRARDSSNAAYVNDVGIALDPEIRAYMKTLTAAQREAAIAVMESQDGRFWLAIGSRIYRSEEHTSELQSLMRISYAVFCLKKKNTYITT